MSFDHHEGKKQEHDCHASFIDLASSHQGDISEHINNRRQKFELERENKRLRIEYDEIAQQYQKIRVEKDKAIAKVKHLELSLKDTQFFYQNEIQKLKNKIRKFQKPVKKINKAPNKQNMNTMNLEHPTSTDVRKSQQQKQNQILSTIINFLFNHAQFPEKQEDKHFWKKINEMQIQLRQLSYSNNPIEAFIKANYHTQANKRFSQDKLAQNIRNLEHRLTQLQQTPFILNSNPNQTNSELTILFESLDAQLGAMLRNTRI